MREGTKSASKKGPGGGPNASVFGPADRKCLADLVRPDQNVPGPILL